MSIEEEIKGIKADDWFLLSVELNPFKDALNIKLQISNGTNHIAQPDVSLKIYDASGRCVNQFKNLSASDGIKPFSHLIWKCCDVMGRILPAGVYFVRLESNKNSITKKVVKLR